MLRQRLGSISECRESRLAAAESSGGSFPTATGRARLVYPEASVLVSLSSAACLGETPVSTAIIVRLGPVVVGTRVPPLVALVGEDFR